ncbi:MAG: DUF3540 domain-containing protein [Desulfosalsimonas sp.]
MIRDKVVPLSIPANESPVASGIVIDVSGKTSIVDISGTRINAQKAFSCFADPEPSDRVICCRDEHGCFFILAITERKNNGVTKITYPSDTAIQVPKGSISIESKNSVTMASENLNFFSGNTVYKSSSATVCFDDITAAGNNLQARYKSVRLISDFINTMARQVIDRFRGYIRSTEETEQVRAGRSARRVKGLYSVESGHTIMASRESTKIDGEKILMG